MTVLVLPLQLASLSEAECLLRSVHLAEGGSSEGFRMAEH